MISAELSAGVAPPSDAERAYAAQLLAATTTSSPVVVTCHVNPDADALGSAIAIALLLRARGREAVVSFASTEPVWGVPATLRFLPGLELTADPVEVLAGPDPALLITTDTASSDRLGPLVALVDRAAETLVVDHHASNTRYGSTHLVDPTAPSTTAVVASLLQPGELDAGIATCLYSGLVTDTGSFRYNGTTGAVHRLAGQLLEAGADPVQIGQQLFDTASLAAVRLVGNALARARREPLLVWTWVGVQERTDAGLPLASIEGIVDVLRTAAEVDVAVVCKGVQDGEWSVSMRSRGATDVGAIAVSLGGGGHPLAAGFTAFETDPEAVVAAVCAALG
jgi:phosphoesterase RecJ-like protein